MTLRWGVSLIGNRKLIMGLVICLTILVMTPRPVSAVWREYVGTVTDRYAVPIFVLYDPPGESSYSEWQMTEQNTHGFEWTSEAVVVVHGTHELTWKHTKAVGTPDNDRVHRVIYWEYELEWEIWYYITSSSSYYKLILTSQTEIGFGYYNFGSPKLNGWVDNRIGEEGDWRKHRDFDAPTIAWEEFSYVYETKHKLGAGITVSYGGLSFKLEALAIEETVKGWTATYHYEDDGALEFWINSDNDWSGSDPNWDLDGIGIWFSE